MRQTGRWRATYTPGEWVVLSGPTSMVVLQPAPGKASTLVNAMWDDVVASSSIDDLVQRLAAFNIERMPSFAAFFWDRGRLRSLVRGSVRIMDLATGDYVADGNGIQTWSEVGLGEVRQVRIDMAPMAEGALQLPLVVGAVTASAIVLDATDDAVVSSPQSVQEGTAGASAATADGATVEPVGEEPVDVDGEGESVVVADTAALAAANPGVRPAPPKPSASLPSAEESPQATDHPTVPAGGEHSDAQQPRPEYGDSPSQYGQPQYGQPQYGQPQYGQPQYGQPQYGAPAAGGPPPYPQQIAPQAPIDRSPFSAPGQSAPSAGPPVPSPTAPPPTVPPAGPPPAGPPPAGPPPAGPHPAGPHPASPTPSGPVVRPEDEADHDGATVFATSLARAHKTADAGSGGGEGLVLADLCVVAHPNPPGSQRCRICGGSIPTQSPRLVTRPVLAVLRPSQGPSIDVDRPVLIGRSPTADRVAQDNLPRLMTVPSPSHDISRTHVRITPQGWDLTVMDEYSTNGTILVRPGAEPERERLTPGEPVSVQPGHVLDLGDGITITIEPPA